MSHPTLRLVGRQWEMETARSLIDRLERGEGGCLFFVGESGIGKTRLAAEVADIACRRHIAAASVSCLPLSIPMPLDPVLTLARRLGGYSGERFHDEASHDLFPTMMSFFAARAAHEPLVLVVEDLHWADSETLELITYATDRLADLPIAWILTSRDEGPVHRLSEHLATLPFGVVARLRALSEEQLRELAHEVTGREGIDANAIAVVHARTGGNPLLAIELLRPAIEESCESEDVLEVVEWSIPHGLFEVVETRRAALEPAADEVLQWIAILPRPALLRWIGAVAGEGALDVIPLLVESNFLVLTDQGRAVDFVHAVVGEAVREAMLEPERVRRHGIVADLLSDGPFELLAPQLIAADRLQEAGAVTFRLAEQALLRGSPLDAVHLYRRTSELARSVGRDDLARRADGGLILSLLRAGEHADARSKSVLLLAELRYGGHREELLLFLSRYAMALWDDAADLPSAIEAVEEAAPLLASAAGCSLAEGALARAHILNRASRTREALDLGEMALGAAREAHAEVLEVRCLVHLGLIRGQVIGAPEGMAVLEEAVALARRRRLPAEEGYAYLGLSFLSQHCGDEKGHENYALSGLEVGNLPPPIEAMLRGNAAQGPVSRGELTSAVAALEQAKELAARAGRHVAQRLAVTLSHAYIKKGDLAAARRELDSLSAPSGSWEDRRITYARAFLAEAEGDLRQAADLYRQGCIGTDNPASIWSIAGVIRIESQLADGGDDTTLLETLDRLADRWPVANWLIPSSRGYWHLGRGESALAADLLAEAAALCEDAYTCARLRLDAALCRDDRQAILDSIDSLDQMGAAVAADRARAEARSRGMRPGRRRRARGALTERELDVARLVAEGKTNAEIGAELYVSPRTVERHVGNLLRRHGLRSRTELASAIVAGDLSEVG